MKKNLKTQGILFIFICLFLSTLIPACSRDSTDRAKTRQHRGEEKAEKGIVKEPQAEVSKTLEEREEKRAVQEEENTPPVIKDARLVLDMEYDKPVLRAEVRADDPDGDDVEIQYQWYKNGEDAGENENFYDFKRGDRVSVVVRAFDGKDFSRQRKLDIDIMNTPPRVIEDKAFSFDGKTFLKRVRAVDPDGDTLSFRLIEAPKGASISPDGLFRWDVPEDFTGSRPVRVEVEDGHGGKAVYDFNIIIKQEKGEK